MAGCLTEDVVAALAAGGLHAVELAGAEEHLDRCGACRALVAEVAGAVPTMPSAPVARIGRYQVRRVVGAGGMGTVYAAVDPDLDREVALKVVHPKGDDEREQLQNRLIREARAMARLAHPNVITVYEVDATGDQLFIAMELVIGTTLRWWCAAERHDWRAIVAVLVAAGRGLAAAHGAGVIHRDFKPDNVLVGKDGRVRVSDFGLAALRTDAAPRDEPARGSPDLGSTAGGMLIGTPAYMAPEQLRGEVADERSEVFGFSVALWEALYGERPFAGDDLAALTREVTAGRIRVPRDERDVPARVRELVARGLAPTRDDRSSLAELLDRLEATAATEAMSAPLFGRDAELAARIARVRTAGTGAFVLVTREAGIGTSSVQLGVVPGERASEDRFRRFDAVARMLADTPQREPLAIMASVPALVFVAQQLATSPVLVAASSGPLDPNAPAELAGDVARVEGEAPWLARTADAVRAWLGARARRASRWIAPPRIHSSPRGGKRFSTSAGPRRCRRHGAPCLARSVARREELGA